MAAPKRRKSLGRVMRGASGATIIFGMATHFHTESGAFVGNSFFGGTDRGRCFDWGVDRERAFMVMEAADAGESFVGEDGREFTGSEFVEWVQGATWTFGEFGGTFQVGSGDMATWEGF